MSIALRSPAAARTLARQDEETVAHDAPARRPSPWRKLGWTGVAAIVFLGLLIVVALIGPPLWRWQALDQHMDALLQDPSLSHPLGTDEFGRDILARLLLGARWSLAGAAAICVGTSVLGFFVAALAVSGDRKTDAILGRIIEAMMALPGLVTALAFAAILGASFTNLLFALIVTSWPWYARTYRALLLKERQALYVESAIAAGAGKWRVLLRHVLPNIIGPAAVLATANFGSVILNLAGLSFLGLGMQPPTPEWGEMINEAARYFQDYPWQMIAPGLCIGATVLAVNLLGDALRDVADPRTR
jgi:ABC-type dipeptide/oligopeptide/nickel transport system permease subunit